MSSSRLRERNAKAEEDGGISQLDVSKTNQNVPTGARPKPKSTVKESQRVRSSQRQKDNLQAKKPDEERTLQQDTLQENLKPTVKDRSKSKSTVTEIQTVRSSQRQRNVSQASKLEDEGTLQHDAMRGKKSSIAKDRPKPRSTVKQVQLRRSSSQRQNDSARLKRPEEEEQQQQNGSHAEDELANNSSSSDEPDRSSDADYGKSKLKGKKENGRFKREKNGKSGKQKSSLILPKKNNKLMKETDLLAIRLKELDEKINQQTYMDISIESEEDENKEMPKNAKTLTHCPFCNELLPENPSRGLRKLIQYLLDEYHHGLSQLKQRSSFECCYRHREEKEAIPLAAMRGWPTSMNREKLRRRLKNDSVLLESLSTRIRKPETSLFFGILMKRRADLGKQSGSSMRQMDSFNEEQAGYYGERGWAEIRTVLRNLFDNPESPYINISSVRANPICPISTNEFIDKVLLPEVVCSLIREDEVKRRSKILNATRSSSKIIDGMSTEEKEKMLNLNVTMEEAIKIRDESNTYGIIMFPIDDIGYNVGDSLFEDDRRPRSSSVSAAEKQGLSSVTSSPQTKRKLSNGNEKRISQHADQPISVPSAQIAGVNRSSKSKSKVEEPPTLSPNRPRPRPSQTNLSQAWKKVDDTPFSDDIFVSQRQQFQPEDRIISCEIPPSSVSSVFMETQESGKGAGLQESLPFIHRSSVNASQTSTDLTSLDDDYQLSDDKSFSSQPFSSEKVEETRPKQRRRQ